MEFVQLIIFVLLIIISISSSIVLLRHLLQWIQQNSYRSIRFLRRFFDRNTGFLSDKIIYSVLSISGLLIIITILKIVLSPSVFDYFSILLIILSILLSIDMIIFSLKKVDKIKKEKKAFVFTNRATRLTILSFIILITLFAVYLIICFNLLNNYYLLFTPVITLLTPFILLLSNTIILPIENYINNSYIKDAIRIREEMKALKVVGITGSYGKTTTKNIINKIASQKYLSVQTPQSYNTELGITRAIRSKLKGFHNIFVVEMAARQRYDIKKCCEIAKPQYGVITNIGKAHLETFKTEENILKTKSELIQYLDDSGIAFINADDKRLVNAINTKELDPPVKAKMIYYGIESDKADVKALNIKNTPSGCCFKAIIKNAYNSGKDAEMEINSKLLGRHNIYNMLAGISVGIELDIPLEYIRYALAVMEPIEHRLKLITQNKDITIIDDSFNSNPEGFMEAVNVLASFDEDYRKIIITPGMVELGNQEYEHNKNAGIKMGENCDYIILVGESRTKPLFDGISDTNFNKDNLYIAKNLEDAKNHLNTIAKPKDVVLFENDLTDVYGG